MSEVIETPAKRQIHVFGGATEQSNGDNPRSAELAKQLAVMAYDEMPNMDVFVHLTDADGGNEGIKTDQDLADFARDIRDDYATRMVLWLPDTPNQFEIAKLFRRGEGSAEGGPRKDISLIGLTATNGASGEEQYYNGLSFLKDSSANLSLAYDLQTENAMVVAPEESTYDESHDLRATMAGLLQIANLRSQLNFTRSTVVSGEPVAWNSDLVYPSLRQVVDTLIDQGAYKPFHGITAGHFAAKVGERHFLTSIRRSNFNDLGKIGLVEVVTDGDDHVTAFGAKPSVGGQSQRIVFEDHPDVDSIAHAHIQIRPGSDVPIVSQREYECGSHECGQNTSNGLKEVAPGILAVHLDNHGPNVVFNHEVDPKQVIEVINDNWDVTTKTGGYQLRAA